MVHGIVAHRRPAVRGLRAVVDAVAGQVLGPGRRGGRHLRRVGARAPGHAVGRRGGGLLGRVHVRLLLRLADVLLVADPLVAEPVGDLADGDAALARQLLLGLLARVGVAQVRVEVLVEDLRGLLAEVAPLAPGVEEAAAQQHDVLAGRLLQLHLDAGELVQDDLDHAVDLLGRDRPGAALLAQQAHHVGGELVAVHLVLVELLVVALADLGELGPVVRVLDRAVVLAEGPGGGGRGARAPAGLLRPGDALGDEHVVEAHQLGVGRLLLLAVALRQGDLLLELAEHGEEGRLHAVAVERVLPGLRLVQALVLDVHDLLQEAADVLAPGLDARRAVDRVHDPVAVARLAGLTLIAAHQTDVLTAVQHLEQRKFSASRAINVSCKADLYIYIYIYIPAASVQVSRCSRRLGLRVVVRWQRATRV